MIGKIFALTMAVLFNASLAFAHHGVASLGVAGLEGPGAPLETSNSATLPKGGALAYLKLDYAAFKTYTPARDDESETNTFWIYGAGYGVTPSFSLYLFAPYHTKRLENSSTTSGFADISISGALGFKYDEGFRLVPEKESLDDLMDWHFTVYGGFTLPTGNDGLRDQSGNLIDPGMQLGFGKPSYSLGLTATKQATDRLTSVLDLSFLGFQEYKYDDGISRRFGDEFRVNYALTYRVLTSQTNKLRLDGNLELNYLHLGRDLEEGVGQSATGGDMLYILPGLRLYLNSTSIGLGVKIPVLTGLNEEDDQQGAEGKEDYRLIFSFSTLF